MADVSGSIFEHAGDHFSCIQGGMEPGSQATKDSKDRVISGIKTT